MDSFGHESTQVYVSVSMSYLRTPSMAGVQGGRVVLLHPLIHTQVAHFRVANLKSQSIFYNHTHLHLSQSFVSSYSYSGVQAQDPNTY